MNSQGADEVLIVERLRIIREAMNLSAEEVELRAGLARSYLCDARERADSSVVGGIGEDRDGTGGSSCEIVL